MKKFLFGALMLSLMSACNTDSVTNQNDPPAEPAVSAGIAQRGCASEEIRQEALKNNPELKQNLQIGNQTENFAKAVKFGKVLADGTVEIPVVVNVIYKTSARKCF
jgi:hypothetical protein